MERDPPSSEAGAKNGETVLQFRGSGPLGTVVAIADALGRARGYVSNPAARDENLEVRCEFCGERYEVGAEEIVALADRASADSQASSQIAP